MRLAEAEKVDLRLAVDFAWARLAREQLAGRGGVGLRKTGMKALDWEELAGLERSEEEGLAAKEGPAGTEEPVVEELVAKEGSAGLEELAGKVELAGMGRPGEEPAAKEEPVAKEEPAAKEGPAGLEELVGVGQPGEEPAATGEAVREYLGLGALEPEACSPVELLAVPKA